MYHIPTYLGGSGPVAAVGTYRACTRNIFSNPYGVSGCFAPLPCCPLPSARLVGPTGDQTGGATSARAKGIFSVLATSS